MMSHALAYAAKGWPVFPLVPRGKMPLISREDGGRGACDATTDPGQIRAWWSESPDANIAVTLPDRLVVDIDPRNGGDEQWTQLCLQHGEPDTLTQQSGSLGLHYVFLRPQFAPRCKPWGGIDVLTGPHRYIVAAPSIHPCGGQYRWIVRRPPAALPEWLAVALRREVPSIPRQSAYDERKNKSTAFQRAARYLDNCPAAVSGSGGHQTTFTTALKLTTAFPELDEAELWILLTDWNNRCQPPWTKRELMHKLSDAMRRVRGGAAA